MMYKRLTNICNTKKRLLLTLLAITAILSTQAQEWKVVRGGCMPDLTDDADNARSTVALNRRFLRKPNNNWDAQKTYKQLVILVAYSDTDFNLEDPNGQYQKMLNEPGYNKGNGPGSMADYYRDQSDGLFNLSFDVFGPYKVSTVARPYTDARNYGRNAMIAATNMMIAENQEWDFTQYDWDSDGSIEQVIYIVAGISGNQGEATLGYLWPNTSSFTTITTPDGVNISNYSASAERWNATLSCGIGTICHEYTHSLGLPDIYPTGGNTGYYSVCDEWDLMDGGNFTNRGWCPPNLTAMEKMLMGWLTPTELTTPVSITNLKTASEGGETFIVKQTDDEYYLLENRQQTGWDKGAPGKGLVIYHVDYKESAWSGNSVNNTKGHFRFELVHADNLDYNQWDAILPATGSQWKNKGSMNNMHLSSSPYPWSTDSTTFVNDRLTNTSTPAAVMFNKNAASLTLLSKPITNIVQNSDGTVSFDFMGGDGAPDRGDVNGDGQIDIVDVTSTISDILGQMPTGFNRLLADINNDGTVDIVDVTSIIDIILKK